MSAPPNQEAITVIQTRIGSETKGLEGDDSWLRTGRGPIPDRPLRHSCAGNAGRGRLAKTIISDQVVSEEERKDAVKDLCSPAHLDYSTVYRPGEEPT